MLMVFLLALQTGCSGRAEWSNAFESTEDLGRAVVEALNRGDAKALHQFRVQKGPYLSWMWPAFPASQPPKNFPGDLAWSNLNRKCLAAIRRGLESYGQRQLSFVELSFDRIEAYPEFRLLRDTTLLARTPEGKQVQIQMLGSIVERDNQYKLLSYQD